MIISYNLPIMNRLGYKQITAIALADDLGDNRVKVVKVLKIDCNSKFYDVSKVYDREIGKVKLLKNCQIVEV